MLDFPSSPIIDQTYPDPPVEGLPVWVWNGIRWDRIGGFATVIVSPTAPTNPTPNMLWFDSSSGAFSLWYDDGNSEQWVEISGSAGGNAALVISPTAPVASEDNSLWWNTSRNALYIWYANQWVPASPTFVIGPTAPVNPEPNSLWWNSTNSTLYVRHNNQWILASSPLIISATQPFNPAPNSLWWNSSDGALYVRYNNQWIEISSSFVSGGGGNGGSGVIGDYLPITGGTLTGDITAPNFRGGEFYGGSFYGGVFAPHGIGYSINITPVAGTATRSSTGAAATLSLDNTDLTQVGLFLYPVQATGTLIPPGSGTKFVLRQNGDCESLGRMIAGGTGIRTTLGGAATVAFHWGGAANANAFINVDNGTGWLQLTNQCDERLKQDIAPSTFDCLSAVEKIPICQFRWMDNSDPGNIRPVKRTKNNLIPIGLIAQRVDEVASSLVVKPPPPIISELPTRTLIPAREDGKQPFSPMQIDSNNMFAVLIGAIQQLSERVKQLEVTR